MVATGTKNSDSTWSTRDSYRLGLRQDGQAAFGIRLLATRGATPPMKKNMLLLVVEGRRARVWFIDVCVTALWPLGAQSDEEGKEEGSKSRSTPTPPTPAQNARHPSLSRPHTNTQNTMAASAASPRSLQELVIGPGFEPARRALAPFFCLRSASAFCKIPPPVAEKYGNSGERQSVITVTDRYLHRQTYWNPQRGQKPQNFKSAVGGGNGNNGNSGTPAPSPALHHALDPLINGAKTTCDFCSPETSTAEDVPFGRYASPPPGASTPQARPRAISASNLFKCAAPFHGVVLLPERHDPLALSRTDVAAVLDCARGWFALAADATAADESPARLHPFLLWNALPRAGASQYHAHAQMTLTDDPVPEQTKLWRAEREFAAKRQRRRGRGAEAEASLDGDYYSSLLRAKAAAGLLRVVTAPSSPSGSGLGLLSLAFSSSSSSLASSLLPLGDGRGGARVAPSSDDDSSSAAVAYVYAALAPVKDAELVIVVPTAGAAADDDAQNGGNLSALRSPALSRALHAALRAVVDGVCGGSGAFNAAVHNLEVPGDGGGGGSDEEHEDDEYSAPPPWPLFETGDDDDGPPASLFPSGRPLIARVVSRGPPTAAASDFGALEVMGGASIGHTDPYRLLGLFDEALERRAADDEEEGVAAALATRP
jgi:hypothetical protein